jgi:hypothetical protein
MCKTVVYVFENYLSHALSSLGCPLDEGLIGLLHPLNSRGLDSIKLRAT